MEQNKSKPSAFAILSFIVAVAFYLLSILQFYNSALAAVVTLAASIVLGILGLIDIKRNNKSGMTFAVLGIAISAVFLVLYSARWLFG